MSAIPVAPALAGTNSVVARPRPGSGLGSLAFSLAPNPSHASVTRVVYTLAEPASVSVGVYGLAGRRVRTAFDGGRSAGSHSEGIDLRDANGRPLDAGVYFVRLQAGPTHGTRRLVALP